MVEIDDEDLAVADLSGLCRRRDGVDGLVDLVRGDRDLDLDLGQEAHGILGAAIDFRMTLLPAISLDFRHRETVNANGGQGVTDFFELEWLDDRHNNFHGSYPRYCQGLDTILPSAGAAERYFDGAAYCRASPCCVISRPSISCSLETRSGRNSP